MQSTGGVFDPQAFITLEFVARHSTLLAASASGKSYTAARVLSQRVGGVQCFLLFDIVPGCLVSSVILPMELFPRLFVLLAEFEFIQDCQSNCQWVRFGVGNVVGVGNRHVDFTFLEEPRPSTFDLQWERFCDATTNRVHLLLVWMGQVDLRRLALRRSLWLYQYVYVFESLV